MKFRTTTKIVVKETDFEVLESPIKKCDFLTD